MASAPKSAKTIMLNLRCTISRSYIASNVWVSGITTSVRTDWTAARAAARGGGGGGRAGGRGRVARRSQVHRPAEGALEIERRVDLRSERRFRSAEPDGAHDADDRPLAVGFDDRAEGILVLEKPLGGDVVDHHDRFGAFRAVGLGNRAAAQQWYPRRAEIVGRDRLLIRAVVRILGFGE